MTAGDQFVKQDSHGKDVRSLRDLFASGLFRAQVIETAFDDTGDGIQASDAGLSDAEVGQFDFAF